MTKTLAIALTLALAVSSGASSAAKDKPTGVKCGNSYISADKVCHKPDAMTFKLDAKGKCHSSDGKFAKQDMCKKP